MKKPTLLITFFIVFAVFANAQKSKLDGSWLVTKVEVNGDVENPYLVTEFNENGKMILMGIDFGTWRYNKTNHSIVMNSELDKDFNGESKILNLTEKNLIVTKDGAKVFYRKVDKYKIGVNNKDSGLEGSWRIQASGISKLIKFELPDSYTIVEIDGASTATLRGKWIINSEDRTLIITGLSSLLRGKNKIVDFTSEKIVFDNYGNEVVLFKENIEGNKIERLNFTEDDFYTENGDYKYEGDEDKLPWLDSYAMILSLDNVHQLVYKYSTLIEDIEVFDSKMLIADIEANKDEQTLSIDFVFYGYDRYNLPEDTELPPNNEYSNLLFPLKEDMFRVSGNERITTSAGSFDCTVIEVVNGFETRKKLWMINDKPGIYAKIIEDKPGTFGHYSTYELQEIKR